MGVDEPLSKNGNEDYSEYIFACQKLKLKTKLLKPYNFRTSTLKKHLLINDDFKILKSDRRLLSALCQLLIIDTDNVFNYFIESSTLLKHKKRRLAKLVELGVVDLVRVDGVNSRSYECCIISNERIYRAVCGKSMPRSVYPLDQNLKASLHYFESLSKQY